MANKKIRAVLYYQKDTKQYRQFTFGKKKDSKNKIVGSVYLPQTGVFKDAEELKVTIELVKD